MKFSTIIILAFVLLLCCSPNILAQSDDLAIHKKADFIILTAKKISFPKNDTSSLYKIGIYGKEKESTKLFNELKLRSQKLSLQKKPVEVLHFKRTKNITPVDVFYVNGKSKIRISDIDKSLGNYSYIILTENFPFGTSMLNFAVNKHNTVQYEIQPDGIWQKGGQIDNKYLNSPTRIHSEEKWQALLSAKTKELEQEILKTEEQKKTIKAQKEEIIDQNKKINNQQGIIILSIAFIIIVTALSYFLATINRKRKVAIDQLALKNKEITDSIQYAKLIQDALLPNKELLFSSFSGGFIINKPKDIVSGDFYWHNLYGEFSVIAVIDSAGHGVPGAFMSVMGNELFHSVINDSNVKKPGLILQQIDDRIKDSFNDNMSSRAESMDIALICYHKSKQKLYYAGAKRPLIIVRNGNLIINEPTNASIGGPIHQKGQHFETTTISTKPMDCLYLFTDGIQDQFGGIKGKKFSKKSLHKLLLKSAVLNISEQQKVLQDAIINWKGSEEQTDDICLVGLSL